MVDEDKEATPSPEPMYSAPMEEKQSIVNELRGELQDKWARTVNWWLTVMALVLTFFGIVVAFGGYFGFSKFNEIITSAEKKVYEAEEVITDAKNSTKEIKQEVKRVINNAEESVKQAKKITTRAEKKIKDAEQVVTNSQQYVNMFQDTFQEATDLIRMIRKRKEISEELAQELVEIFVLILKAKAPVNAEAYNSQATVKLWLGQYKAAIADYNHAIQLKDDFALAHKNRGNAKAALGQFKDAIEDYKKAIELVRNNFSKSHKKYLPKEFISKIYRNLGNTKIALRQYEEAIQDYKAAIKLKSDFALAYYDLGKVKIEFSRTKGGATNKVRLRSEAKDNFEKAENLARKTGDVVLVALAQRALRGLAFEFFSGLSIPVVKMAPSALSNPPSSSWLYYLEDFMSK